MTPTMSGAYLNAEGCLIDFDPNGDATYLFSEIAENLDVVIVSESDPQYWGFETFEEMSAQLNAEAQAIQLRQRQFEEYWEIIKFLRRKRNNISPGTVQMWKAEIAKCLVTESPHLLDPSRRPELIEATETIYDSDLRRRTELMVKASFDQIGSSAVEW